MRSFTLKYILVLIILCVATWIIWSTFDYSLTGIDDSNIFFVYAKNLANGHGFVYNVGGERVEGFTSLLWILLCALVFHVSSKPEFVLLILNIVITALGVTVALTCIQSGYLGQKDSSSTRRLSSVIFLILLFILPAYIVWSTITLMETAIWCVLLLFATIFVTKENISLRIINLGFIPLSVLLLLLRPESFVWALVFIAILLVRRTLATGITQALKDMIPSFVAVIVTISALTVFRAWYFGYPLPNTFYAKVSPSFFYNLYQGTIYFAGYFLSNLVVSICILAAILASVHTILMLAKRRFSEGGLLFLPILADTGLLIPILTGGDRIGSFRFYQIIYPILLLCLLYCVKSVLPQYINFRFSPNALRWPQTIFVTSLAALFVSSFVLYEAREWKDFKQISGLANTFEIAKNEREQGQIIREMFNDMQPLPSIGVVRAGGIKYTYPGEIVDLLGLNNLLIAHNGGNRFGEKSHAAFEKPSFFQLQPDMVSTEIVSNENWQYNAIDLKKSWDNTVPLKGLYNDPAFLNLYGYAKIYRKGSETDKALVGWFRKDFLNDVNTTGYFVIERYPYVVN